MSTNPTFMEGFVLEIFKETFLKDGDKHFERFKTAAGISNIPEDLIVASTNQLFSWEKIADATFGLPHGFQNMDEVRYAVCYARAISNVKSWQTTVKKAEKAKVNTQLILPKVKAVIVQLRTFADALGYELDDAPSRFNDDESRAYFGLSLIDLKSLVAFYLDVESGVHAKEIEDWVTTTYNAACISCGAVLQLEKYADDIPLKHFRAWLKQRLGRLFGKKATREQLAQTIIWIEEYYASNKK